MSRPQYFIGTGWWCPIDRKQDERVRFHGDDFIRSEHFHHIWYETLLHVATPERIILIDSASPVLPPCNPCDPRIVTLKLAQNPGHASNHTGHYGGWMASVLLSLEYALCHDVEYFVYVEQDVLLQGKGFIEHCIAAMRSPYMFGDGRGTPQPLQQSVFIIRRDGMRPFLAGLHRLRQRDYDLHPEWKFALASAPVYMRALAPMIARFKDSRLLGLVRAFLRLQAPFDVLPVGYGRARPLHIDDPFYYFQHGSIDELRCYLAQLPEELMARIEAKHPGLAAPIRTQ